MFDLSAQRSVVILYDSWYAKKHLLCVVDAYTNLDVICNARYDSVIYDLEPQPIGRRGRPARHGRCLSTEGDFTLFDERVGNYYIGVRKVLTNIFGQREVLVYVIASEGTQGSRRLLFSTVFPHQMQIFCAWQKKASLNQIGRSYMR